MAGSSKSQGLSSCKFDVFISFRGKDTRKNFTSHLYAALRDKKIETYKDDVSLPRGNEISPALYEGIEGSKISIVVFSRDYGASRWCLEELVHILRCRRERGQVVLPVFYGVDPSNVRKQRESFGSAFVQHEKRFEDEMGKVVQWRSALEEAGNLSGWDSTNHESESQLVDEIAQVTLSHLNSISSVTSSGNHELRSSLVGMEKRLEKIESLLRMDTPDVRIIGVWGMGGIGKSTVAREVQKRYTSRFESCFFEDVSDGAKRHGLSHLKEKLFATLLKDGNLDMDSSFKDVRLRRTKAFIVLDNVDELEQLECLIGDHIKSRFGEGSKIILTGRDKKLLMERADDLYNVDAFDFNESIELFYQNSFRGDSSKILDYTVLSNRVVAYCGGNPLALKVLGSYLRSRSVKEWESALSELKNAPNERVQEVLKISYDALDRGKKSMFLDIACFFRGNRREVVEEILGDESHISINVLVEKSLITDIYGKLWMHDLTQEMAWEIVRQESIELGHRSRLWIAREIYSVLKRNRGSARIEGILLDLSKMSGELYLRSTVFEAMENLRFLKIYCSRGVRKSIHFNQDLQYLPDSLRWLDWADCPLKSLPSDFEPQNLVKLYMTDSKLEKLWNGIVHLGNLKQIKLGRSRELVKLPDLSQAPKLERVDLSSCSRLRQLPKISEHLNFLNMNGSGVEEFHSSFESLQNLQYLNLSNCKSLKSLPKLPRNIKTLCLLGFQSFANSPIVNSFIGLHSLNKLDLIWCGISHIPDQLGLLLSVESLTLSGNNFKRIPSTIKQMLKLKSLRLADCKKLESLPDLPSSIVSLYAGQCVSLKMINARRCASMEWLCASGCTSLTHVAIYERASAPLVKLSCRFNFFYCLKLDQTARDNISTAFGSLLSGSLTTDFKTRSRIDATACYPGNKIPAWFNRQSEGSSIHLKLPCRAYSTDFVCFFASVVVAFDNVTIRDSGTYELSCRLRLKRCHGTREYTRSCLFQLQTGEVGVRRVTDHVMMWYICHYDEADNVSEDIVEEALFDFGDCLFWGETKIKRCGICMISPEETEEFVARGSTFSTVCDDEIMSELIRKFSSLKI